MSNTATPTSPTSPLTYQEMRNFITDSYKPKSEWKIGFEYETSGVHREDLKPIDFRGERSIEGVLAWFRAKYGEESGIWEGDYCYGIELPYGRLTLEPGGQIEFSSSTELTLQSMRKQLQDFLSDICTAGAEDQITFYTAGVDPLSPLSARPWSGKARYKIMREYLSKQGKYAHHMMLQTMSIQYNIDFSDEQDALDKYHASIALYPIFQFLTTNSSIYAGKVVDAPFRRTIWEDMDPDRSGLPPHLKGIDDYIEYALDVPMFFLQRGKEMIPMAKRTTFREFWEQGLDGHQANKEDWALHLTTLFPEVRFKKNALELRMFDGNIPSMMEAMAAVVKGIFYDKAQLTKALEIDWSGDWESAQRLYDLAKDGLEEEEHLFLYPLVQLIEKRQTPGEQSVAVLENSGGDLHALLKHLRLCPELFKKKTLRI